MNLVSFMLCRDLEKRQKTSLFILWDAGINLIPSESFPFRMDFVGLAVWQKEPLDGQKVEFSFRIVDGDGKEFAPTTKGYAFFEEGPSCKIVMPMLFEFKKPGLYRFDFFWCDRHREGWLLEIKTMGSM